MVNEHKWQILLLREYTRSSLRLLQGEQRARNHLDYQEAEADRHGYGVGRWNLPLGRGDGEGVEKQ